MPEMLLKARSRDISFPRRPLIMGIVNINDDSFSGDGRIDSAWALDYARDQINAGADIIDVGAESARTNRGPITEEEEIRRLLPFIERFEEIWRGSKPADTQQLWPPLLSINSWRPAVARAVLPRGGDIFNDMGGLPTDENARICAETGAALLIMHTVGEPKVPHTHIRYQNITDEVAAFFREKMAMAEKAGLEHDRIILDPGLDFAKQGEDNLRILRELESFHALARPLLLPLSRKSFIGKALGIENPVERDAATIACAVIARLGGAAILRMHNVRAAWQTMATIEAVETVA